MTHFPQHIEAAPGSPLPLGANVIRDGVQFSIFSRNADAVTLVLFKEKSHLSEHISIPLDPDTHRTGDIWHIWIADLKEGQQYGYLIQGPESRKEGHRFNPNRLLLDPYARAITDNFRWDLKKAQDRPPESDEFSEELFSVNTIYDVPRAIVISPGELLEDKIIKVPPEDTIIYELHVRGFTRHESSGTDFPGTYKGLTEKIPYLKELGVNAVELLPIQEFDEYENININPLTGEKLKNYWGYSTLSFFAPKGSYSSTESMGLQILEFKEMVKEFHKAGIEVILDVVFNHTAEGDHRGPTISFRGIDNSIYYILEDDRSRYRNYSGCGNTLNCNHPLVRDFILDCLRYWVVEMKIDGFRFDLASILGRDQDGTILSDPPLIERIEEDPILRDAKIIAEAWDAAGAYQVGNFPGRWQEWNGRFRDDIRRFWKGEANCTGVFATRICGSSDLYDRSGKAPTRSINFITCHDGFTLNDLVSYNEKHNLANGEDNRDGENHNLSRNMGTEGPAETAYMDKTRKRQAKNFLITLFASQGIPMLLAGDEFMRTQQGNNNTYCQDNELSWIDWGLLKKNKDIFRFTREIISLRRDHAVLRRRSFLAGDSDEGHPTPDITWHGVEAFSPDWTPRSRSIACCLAGSYAATEDNPEPHDLYMIFNASTVSQSYELPPSPSGRPWKLKVDTALESPGDIYPAGEEKPVEGSRYHVTRLSTVVLST